MVGFYTSSYDLTSQSHINESNLNNSTTVGPNIITTVQSIWKRVSSHPQYLIARSVNFYGDRVINSLGTLFNAVILITMLSSRHLRHNSSGILIILLAILELFDAIFRICVREVDLYGLCVILEFVRGFLIFMGNNVILLIAINRFALVCFPLRHHQVTDIKATLIQITVLALIGFGANSFLFAVNIHYRNHNCILTRETFEIYFNGVLAAYICIGSLTPVLGTLILTIIVIVRLTSHRGLMKTSSRQGKIQQAQKAITKVMIGVGISFVLLTLPYSIFYIVNYYTAKTHGFNQVLLFKQLDLYLALFHQLNRINNFFLYVGYHTKFKERLIQLLRCKWKSDAGHFTGNT